MLDKENKENKKSYLTKSTKHKKPREAVFRRRKKKNVIENAVKCANRAQRNLQLSKVLSAQMPEMPDV